MNAAGCGTFFSYLISPFVFDILQIRSGCFAPTCTTPAMGLTYRGREEVTAENCIVWSFVTYILVSSYQ